MTKEQLQTRVKWALKELKGQNVIPDDIQLDTRSFAIRSAKHVKKNLFKPDDRIKKDLKSFQKILLKKLKFLRFLNFYGDLYAMIYFFFGKE